MDLQKIEEIEHSYESINENFFDILTENDNFDVIGKKSIEQITTNDKDFKEISIGKTGFFDEPEGKLYYQVESEAQFENEDPLFENDQEPGKIEVQQGNIPIEHVSPASQIPRNAEIIDAQLLKARFPEIKFEIKKATNAPKFLYKTFFDGIQNELIGDHDGDAHLWWLNHYYESHHTQKTKTRFELIDLFGDAKSDKKERRSRIRRAILQRKLANLKVELIMSNNMIPQNNKLHYLYFSKVYEWRLNDARLIARFN